MKKRLHRIVFLTTVLVPLAYLQARCIPFPGNSTDGAFVTVEGTAPLIGDNIESAKNTARLDAYRRAIEEGVGVSIAARTQTAMLAVVSDVVITRSEGYIHSCEILDEWKDEDDIYHVTIRAEVRRGDIRSDRDGLKILVDYVIGNPLVMILFSEENMGEASLHSTAEAEMERVFSSAGYHLLAGRKAGSLTEHGTEVIEKILAGDEEAAAVLAEGSGADIVIVGRAETEQFTEAVTKEAGLVNAVAHSKVRVIITSTRRVVLAEQSTSKSVHLSAAAAGSRAIAKSAGELAERLIYEIPARLSESRTIRVTVTNCGYAERKIIMENLEKDAEVSKVFPRSFEGGTAHFDVKTWSDAERIAERIDAMDDPDLGITAVNAGEVKATTRKPREKE